MSKSNILTIIGMGEGISMSVAQKFGKAGFTIAMISRNDEKLSQIQKLLSRDKIESYYFIADVKDSAQIKASIEYIHESLGPTEVLLYNAAAVHQTDLLTIDEDELLQDFKVNTIGALMACRAVFDTMQSEGQGKIFFTGGGLSLAPQPAYGSLAIGKAGLRNLAFSLHQQLKPLNIQVSTVTVNGYVQKHDEKYNPDAIAEQFWLLYQQPIEEAETEIIY